MYTEEQPCGDLYGENKTEYEYNNICSLIGDEPPI
jgi:hypothetical protein